MHLFQPQQKQMPIIHCLRHKGNDRMVPADSADWNMVVASASL
jgi:hypothetical protein